MKYVEELSKKWKQTDLQFALLCEYTPPSAKYEIYEITDGEGIHHFEETLSQFFKRNNQQFIGCIKQQFENMLFPKNSHIFCINDLRSEILSFVPHYGLDMQTLCVLEEVWKYINTEWMSGTKYYEKKWYEKTDNFAFLLYTQLRQKLFEIRDQNEHIRHITRKKFIENTFFDKYLVKLIHQITGFEMRRRAKCKYYGSAAGCKNGDKCSWSHNNPQSVPLCSYFNSFDGCNRGDQCYFRHEEIEKPDIDCFFDVELERNIHQRIPPAKYFCFKCKAIGEHWIMDCLTKQ